MDEQAGSKPLWRPLAAGVMMLTAAGSVSTLLLAVERLSGTIGWPWWAVTAPLWGVVALFAVTAVALIATGGSGRMIDEG